MSRFVKPETTTLKISQGDTLTVKRRLNSGEQRAMMARMSIAGVDGQMRVNGMQVGLSMVLSYLVDWSICDDGKHVDILGKSTEELSSIIDALDLDSFKEIREAIEAHDDAVRTSREQEKNGQGGVTGSSAISPSPVVVTGDTSGSVN